MCLCVCVCVLCLFVVVVVVVLCVVVCVFFGRERFSNTHASRCGYTTAVSALVRGWAGGGGYPCQYRKIHRSCSSADVDKQISNKNSPPKAARKF